MDDGQPHPEASDPIITGPVFSPGVHTVGGEVQLTGCRLAARVVVPLEPEHLIVWDWKTGEKHMVRPSNYSCPAATQSRHFEPTGDFGFVLRGG